MNTQPKNISPEGAAAARLFELDEVVTRRQLSDVVEGIAQAVLTLVDANLEHWTDGEGLHYAPFFEDLKAELPDKILEQLT